MDGNALFLLEDGTLCAPVALVVTTASVGLSADQRAEQALSAGLFASTRLGPRLFRG